MKNINKIIKRITSVILAVVILGEGVMQSIPASAQEAPLDYVLYAESDNGIKLNGKNVNVNGNVYSNGDILWNIDDYININGIMNSIGKIPDYYSGNTKSEKQESDDFSQELKKVSFEQILNGDREYINKQIELYGGIKIKGNVLLDQVVFSGQGCFWAQENITMEILSQKENDSEVFLYSQNGNIEITGTNYTINGIIYAPEGKVELNGKNITINGQIIADSIEINGTEVAINNKEYKDLFTTSPDVNITVMGNLKENRKIILSIENSKNMQNIVNEDISWSITKEEKSENVLYDNENSTATKKYIIIKSAGKYKIQVTIKNKAGESYTFFKYIVVEKDLEPVAAFTTQIEPRDENKKAIIHIKDISYSPDGDEIEERVWTIQYDSNNDGIFDEESLIISDENEEIVNYETTNVGNYKIELKIKEKLSDTIENLISLEDIKCADTQALNEELKICTVTNGAPSASISISKEKSVNILAVYEDTRSEEYIALSEELSKLKEELNQKGIYVDISSINNAITLNEAVTQWTEIIHNSYNDTDIKESQVVISQNNVTMLGQKEDNCKDIVIYNNDYSQKEITFQLNLPEENKGLSGAGMIFNAQCEPQKDHTYELINEGMAWEIAKVLCEEKGGHLVTISCKDEADYIFEHVMNERIMYSYWIGLREYAGDCQWVTGEKYRYKAWPMGEPNSSGETYVQMFSINGTWNDTLNYKDGNDVWSTARIGTMCEYDSIIEGYCLLLTTEGIELIKLNPTSEEDLVNGCYGSLEDVGKVLEIFPIENIYGIHNIKMDLSLNTISLWDNNKPVVLGYELPEEIGADFGPVAEYKWEEDIEAEEKNEVKPVTFSNFEMKVRTGQCIKDVIEGADYKSNSNNFVIYLSGKSPYGINSDYEYAQVIKTLTEKNVSFVGINAENSQNTLNKIVYGADGIKINNPQDTKQAINYVLSKCINKDYSVDNIITTQDKVVYKGYYFDDENDPMYESIWEYHYDSKGIDEIYSNSTDDDEESVQVGELQSESIETSEEVFITKEPLKSFVNPGVYAISLKVRDNPVGDNDSLDEFRLWSEDDLYKQVIIVTQKPKAQVEVSYQLSETEENIYYISEKVPETEGVTTKLLWKEITDETWREGTLPLKIEGGKVYLVKAVAQNSQGVEGDSYIQIVAPKKAEAIKIEEPEIIDTEAPEVTITTSKENASYLDTIIISGNATDNTFVKDFALYVNGTKCLNDKGSFNYVCYLTENIEITAHATDIYGNEREISKTITVTDDRDKVAPEIKIISPANNENISGIINFVGTVTDNTDIYLYRLVYRKIGSVENVIFSEGNEIKEKEIIGQLDTRNLENGAYEICLSASDKIGNISKIYNYYVVNNDISDDGMDHEPPQITITVKENNSQQQKYYLNSNRLKDTINSTVNKYENNLNNNEEKQKEYTVTCTATDNEALKEITVYKDNEPVMYNQGEVTFILDENQKTQIKVYAKDQSGNTAIKELEIINQVKLMEDTVKPQAEITLPENNANADNTINIIGTAKDEIAIKSYELSYKNIESEEYLVFFQSSISKENEVLTSLDTTNFINGIYDIKLTVYDQNGNKSEAKTRINIQNQSTDEENQAHMWVSFSAVKVKTTEEITAYVNGKNISDIKILVDGIQINSQGENRQSLPVINQQ